MIHATAKYWNQKLVPSLNKKKKIVLLTSTREKHMLTVTSINNNLVTTHWFEGKQKMLNELEFPADVTLQHTTDKI